MIIYTTLRYFFLKQLKKLIQDLPDEFLVTIDDMDFLFWEIDGEDGRIDFSRDYREGR